MEPTERLHRNRERLGRSGVTVTNTVRDIQYDAKTHQLNGYESTLKEGPGVSEFTEILRTIEDPTIIQTAYFTPIKKSSRAGRFDHHK